MIALLAFLVVLPGLGVTSGTASGTRLAAYITSATQVSDQVLEEVGLPVDLNPPCHCPASRPSLTEGSRLSSTWVRSLPVLRRRSLGARGRVVEVRHVLQPGPGHLVVVQRCLPRPKSWSFYGSSYSSPYLVFDPAELASSTLPSSGASSPLGPLSPLQQRVFLGYDHAPYSPSRATGAIPFIDVANRYLQIGAERGPLGPQKG